MTWRRAGDTEAGEKVYEDVPVRFPPVVKVAGWLWIGLGAFLIIGTMIGMANPRGNAARGNPMPCWGGVVGVVFVICGHHTVTGKARDTLGNGAGSILLGILQLTVATLIASGMFKPGQGANAQGRPEEVAVVVIAVVGAILFVAGVLALIGRSAFREWRHENTPGQR
jgi:hypothetical protein